MDIMKSSQKKHILNKLNEQFGITKLPYLLLRFGKEKIRVYSGDLSSEELRNIDKNLRLEVAGLYAMKEQEDGIRLTLDGVSLFKDQIRKNILEIGDEDAREWFKGNDLLIEDEKGFKILKNNNELIGCGKSTGIKITNFVSKNRRVKD